MPETVIVRGLLFLQCPDRLRSPPNLLFSGNRDYFPEIKRPGREIDHSSSSNARVKNDRMCTSFIHGVDRDNFTCTLMIVTFLLKIFNICVNFILSLIQSPSSLTTYRTVVTIWSTVSKFGDLNFFPSRFYLVYLLCDSCTE